MPLSPQEFYNRAIAQADAEHRLPVPAQAWWETFPFEVEGLRSKPLEPPVLPEPPREGEDGTGCGSCAPAQPWWGNERWVLSGMREAPGVAFVAILGPREHLDFGDLDDAMAAELGVLLLRAERAVRALGDVGRVHIYKIGDGGAHLHVFLIARPAGMLQLRGSNLPLWDDVLPATPRETYEADLRAVATTLASYDGEVLR